VDTYKLIISATLQERKKETQNTDYREKLMLKYLLTVRTKPAVKVVMQHEHTNYW
jgi:hypothetical protein